MKDEQPTENGQKSSKSFLSVDLIGKDKKVWNVFQSRFVTRLVNSIRSVFSSQIPGRTTIHDEAQEALKNIAASAQDLIKAPQFKNMEKQAEIVKKLSEANLNNSKARKLNAEASLIENNHSITDITEEVHHSQKVVDALIKTGELYPEVVDGKLHLIFKPKSK